MSSNLDRESLLRSSALALATLMLVLVGSVGPASAAAPDKTPSVTVRTTEGGVPRILANGWRGLGYGYGFETARHNICTTADAYLTVRGQRSRFLGPEKTWFFSGNGMTYTNLQADFFFKRMIVEKQAEKLLRQKAPRGPKPQVRRIVKGYVQGYNRYLKRVGVNRIPDRTCRGEKWVRPIRRIDVYRRFLELGTMASSGVAIDGLVDVTPPGAPVPAAATAAKANPDARDLERIAETRPQIGSNAIALGRKATSTGKGMMMGNSHFPWGGSERWFQSQLTIPGKINVSGVSLYGVPLILIGHTAKMAWSHTVSPGFRFVPIVEKLVPGDPTSYYVDGQPRQMRKTTVTVEVKADDGTITPETRTFYSTIHGPITNSLQGQKLFAWSDSTAYALGDANAGNLRLVNFFFDMNRAQTTRGVMRALRTNQGVPWVSTLASDARGNALYADISVVPNLPDDMVERCNTGLGFVSLPQLGLPVIDGSKSECDLQKAPGAVVRGILPPDQLPYEIRKDYVENSNDSHWLVNPKQPLEGFAGILGRERSWIGLRARNGLTQIQERLAGTDGKRGKRFNLAQLWATVFDNKVFRAEMIQDPLVAYCNEHPVIDPGDGIGPVDVSEACPILAAWNLRDDLDAPGAVLFRRIAPRLDGSTWVKPFDVNDPVGTPSGLNQGSPSVGKALALAVNDLRTSGMPLDATLRRYQYVVRRGKRIPIGGGDGESAGTFNVIGSPWVPGSGFTDIRGGTSFTFAASLNGSNCPRVRTILAYSQAATNERSPYFADQTKLFSKKKWLMDRFCLGQQLRSPALKVTNFHGGASWSP
ncbi:MAG: penicillin acylase family protein [Thermoleophilia bacterium]|nr:penicillin acylase family protein [Thermoleophilia bacterium]